MFAVAGLALHFSITIPANAASKQQFAQAVLLHAQKTFLQICVAKQPSYKIVRAALKKVESRRVKMPVKLAQLGGSILGLEQTVEKLLINDQKFEGGYVVSRSGTKAFGRAVAVPVIIGRAFSTKLKRKLTICTVGIRNGNRSQINNFASKLLNRKADYKTISRLPNGEKTNWLNWNTSGSKSGIFLIGIAVAGGSHDSSKFVNHLVAVGVERR